MDDIKVMIVDNEQFFSQLLVKTVNSVEGFTVCCTAGDARTGAANIRKYKPELIIIDGHLPGMEGSHFVRRVIPQYPVPIIACTSEYKTARDMLEAGAADHVAKPQQGDLESFRSALSSAMKNAMNLRKIVCMGTTYKLKKNESPKHKDDRLVLIGGSAGSTEVLPHILRGLPANFPPVAVTLHMPEGYTELYVKRLNDDPAIKLRVIEAEDNLIVSPGTAVIARGAQHLRISRSAEGYVTESKAGAKISGHCPSVDALFESAAKLAENAGSCRMIGVILTGMGSDGAAGLLKLRNAGAYTIGQDEKTSMVYGMPKAAYEMGAVSRQRGQMLIAPEIIKKLKEWDSHE